MNQTTKADRIVEELGSHVMTKSHDRHISMRQASELGIKVTALEDDPKLQESMLTVHHACIQTLSATPAYKMVENQVGIGFFLSAGAFQIQPA